jgi:ABC-type branched-subunit amino acid transport system ATPase component
VMALTDRIAVLNYGRLIAQGKPQEVMAHSDVASAYLGTTPVEAAPHA